MSATQNEEIEVTCPDCTLSFEVSRDVIEDSQHMLEEFGYCTGLASFECPAPYFSALGTDPTITRAKPPGLDAALARWETEGGRAAAVDDAPRGTKAPTS